VRTQAEDEGGDAMFLADRDQAGYIDEVQGLAVGEIHAARNRTWASAAPSDPAKHK